MKKPIYRNKPFSQLKLKVRATLVLAIAGFTFREIASLLKISTNTVNRWLKTSYKELGDNIPSKPRNART